MTIRAYRITQRKYVATAFDGEGARRHGGRWNSVGTRMVYVASSLSLATLELLVHTEDYAILEGLYQVIPVDFDEGMVKHLPVDELPRHWNNPQLDGETQRIGDTWASDLASPILAVPSAVTEVELNYLLNPLHPDFDKIAIGPPQALRIDPRL